MRNSILTFVIGVILLFTYSACDRSEDVHEEIVEELVESEEMRGKMRGEGNGAVAGSGGGLTEITGVVVNGGGFLPGIEEPNSNDDDINAYEHRGYVEVYRGSDCNIINSGRFCLQYIHGNTCGDNFTFAWDVDQCGSDTNDFNYSDAVSVPYETGCIYSVNLLVLCNDYFYAYFDFEFAFSESGSGIDESSIIGNYNYQSSSSEGNEPPGAYAISFLPDDE